jgi:hypothetical protein
MRRGMLELPSMTSGAATPKLSLVIAMVLNPAHHEEQ